MFDSTDIDSNADFFFSYFNYTRRSREAPPGTLHDLCAPVIGGVRLVVYATGFDVSQLADSRGNKCSGA